MLRVAILKVNMFTLGPLSTNCYLVCCDETRKAVIVDPGFNRESEAERMLREVKERSLQVEFIVNTHGHPDHTCGNGILKRAVGASILIHEDDAHMLGETGRELAVMFGFRVHSPPADKLLRDGDLIKFGNVELRVIHTPGHSRGSISLVGKNAVFTGDTLFAGSIGRYDFPDSSLGDIKRSVRKLASLPDSLIVYPGHGPTSTIGKEKKINPFVREFLRRKP